VSLTEPGGCSYNNGWAASLHHCNANSVCFCCLHECQRQASAVFVYWQIRGTVLLLWTALFAESHVHSGLCTLYLECYVLLYVYPQETFSNCLHRLSSSCVRRQRSLEASDQAAVPLRRS
jgi:hypothetical protein